MQAQILIEIFTWTLAALSVVGLILNIKKLRSCFPIWAVTNVCWMIYDYSIGAHAQSALFAVYLGLSVWGMIQWKRDAGKGREGA